MISLKISTVHPISPPFTIKNVQFGSIVHVTVWCHFHISAMRLDKFNKDIFNGGMDFLFTAPSRKSAFELKVTVRGVHFVKVTPPN